MGCKCIEICPLPANANGRVEVEKLNRNVPEYIRRGDPDSRRYRKFPGDHQTSVIVPNSLKDGIDVPINAEACNSMVTFYKIRKGAHGGTIRCPYCDECEYGSGSSTR